MSPPLTLGPAGWAVARARRVPFVFNIQDVFPDVADRARLPDGPPGDRRRPLARARHVPAVRRRHGALRRTGRQRARQDHAGSTRRVPTARPARCGSSRTSSTRRDPARRPRERLPAEHGLTGQAVVMYAGNVGLSQSLDLVLLAARSAPLDGPSGVRDQRRGAARRARGAPRPASTTSCFVDMQPKARLPEVLAAADVHVVPLRRPRLVERAVEAVLDPRRGPADRGQRRPGHRGRPHRRTRPVPASRCRPMTPRPSPPPSGGSSTSRRGGGPWGPRAGLRRGVGVARCGGRGLRGAVRGVGRPARRG